MSPTLRASSPADGLNISQEILDALTDVKMPRLSPQPPIKEWISAGGWKIPLRRASVVIVGSMLAVIPALLHYRAPIADALRHD